jgi:hypothetical protein
MEKSRPNILYEMSTVLTDATLLCRRVLVSPLLIVFCTCKCKRHGRDGCKQQQECTPEVNDHV